VYHCSSILMCLCRNSGLPVRGSFLWSGGVDHRLQDSFSGLGTCLVSSGFDSIRFVSNAIALHCIHCCYLMCASLTETEKSILTFAERSIDLSTVLLYSYSYSLWVSCGRTLSGRCPVLSMLCSGAGFGHRSMCLGIVALH